MAEEAFSTATDCTHDVVMRLSPIESSRRRPAPIHPCFTTLFPVVAPSIRTSVLSGNIDPPVTVARCPGPSTTTKR